MTDDPIHVIDGSDGVWCRVASYDVTVWQPGVECSNSRSWKLTVSYAGHGKWAVMEGPYMLDADGKPDYSRAGDHLFTLAEAKKLAHEQAPGVTINGLTATETLARCREVHSHA
jgi:hypothetical protein